MRIAVSGAHLTGKTTLARELASRLKGYSLLEEPYYELLEQGHEFSELPGIEDFEMQLDESINQILNSGENTIFDRCPLDFLSYIQEHKDSRFFEINDWKEKIDDAMAQLDLVVFVPVENPDIIASFHSEYPELREEVNSGIRNLIYDYELKFGFKAIEVSGNINNRLTRILGFINQS